MCGLSWTNVAGMCVCVLQAYVSERVPAWLYYKISLPGMMNARKRALKKMAAKEAKAK